MNEPSDHEGKMTGVPKTFGMHREGGSLAWYVIHTKPRQESVAQTSLEREGIETFFPKLKRKRTIRRVRRWVTSPLFPNYIFGRFDAQENGRRVKYATGVINVVSFGGKPALVEDAIVAAIHEHCENDTLVIPPPTLSPGDRVEIQVGPLRGLQGVFEREMSDRERVVILLETIATAARVEVSREAIEKLSGTT